MGNRISIPIGTRFGRLVCKEEVGRKNGRRFFFCVCDCGNFKQVSIDRLRNGKTKSCGCLRTEICKNISVKHGLYGTRAYNTWCNMKSRCRNPNNKKYYRYGGRGIIVCDEWLDFKRFYNDMGDPSEGMSLDRVDNDGNYCKENCRWADQKTQSRNTKRNVYIEIEGETKCMTDWCTEKDIDVGTVNARRKRGCSLNDLFVHVKSTNKVEGT